MTFWTTVLASMLGITIMWSVHFFVRFILWRRHQAKANHTFEDLLKALDEVANKEK